MKDSQLIQRTGHTLGLANSTLKAVLLLNLLGRKRGSRLGLDYPTADANEESKALG